MKTFDWKEKYYNNQGIDVTGTAKYYSVLGSKTGTGSRDNPIMSKSMSYTIDSTLIFGNGVFEISLYQERFTIMYLIGQGFDTSLNILSLGGSSNSFYFCKVKVDGTNFIGIINSNYTMLKDCLISNFQNKYTFTISNSILAYCKTFSTNQSRCTYIDSNVTTVLSNTSLFSNCTIILSKDTITNNTKNNYLGFNNCKFQIGNETSPSYLEGSNADELRQNFIARSALQGIPLQLFTEYDTTNVPMGRWIFSNNSIIGEYNTIEDSEIDKFSKKRGIYLGHTDKTVKVIPIVSTENIPQSFAPANPKSKVIISNDSIALDKSTSVIDRNVGYVDSKIIWLGGKYKLTDLNIINNLPAENGLVVNSLFPFGEATTNIEPNINYIVRSKDKLPASIKYNGIVYDTSLLTRNNIFRGVDSITSLETIKGNPEVLPILDYANYNTVQMRIVSELPDTKITSGNLQTGYWYFVTPNDVNDTSGSVTYKGVKRPCFDSFLVDGTTSFSIDGSSKCHLRRCWKQDYSETTETIDKAFWNNKQKPIYFDVSPNDLRCLHKNNSTSEPEMQMDANGKYITSGHIDFYNNLIGSAGFKVPAFDIVGSFMQIKVPISTLNPM